MAPTLSLLLLLPLLLLFAWLARRLLAVRHLSATKTAVSAVIGFVLAELLIIGLSRRDVDDTTLVITGIVAAVLFTMIAIVILELLASPRRRRRKSRSIPRPIRSIRSQSDQARRAVAVARIARKHNLTTGFAGADGVESPEAAADFGRRASAALEEAGGMFVKFGQVLATREDIIPPETARELAKLQGDVTPLPRSEIEPVLTSELGQPVALVFDEFDWEPLGSASIGQVYSARLKSGERVVVKVRRPGIVETVERDIAIVNRFAATLESRTELGTKYGIASIAEEFGANLRSELDYHNEERGAREIAASLATTRDIYIPTVHAELSTSQVLVMELVEGPTLGSGDAAANMAFDRKAAADGLFRAMLSSMVEGDTFHADPHPGNIILLTDGRLGLIDFGSTGRLDAFEQAAVSDITMALHLKDPTLLREAAMTVGSFPDGADVVQLERAFARLMAQHLGPGAVPTADLLTDFLGIAYQFGMTMPPSVTAMFRALATLSGTLDILYGGTYPLIDAAQELASDRMSGELVGDNLSDMVRSEALRLAPLLQRAPRRLDRIAGQIERGELTARVSIFSTPSDAALIIRMVNRATLAFLAAAIGVVSAMLFSVDGVLVLFEDVTLLDLLAYFGLLGGAVLALRVILDVLHDDEQGRI